MKSILLIIFLAVVSVLPRTDAKTDAKALPSLMKAYAANKDKKGLAGQIGTILFRQKAYKKALPYLQQASDKDPRNAEVYRMLGVIYIFSKDDTRAETALLKVVALEPKDKAALESLAEFYEQKGKSPSAIKYYGQAAELKGAKTDALEERIASIHLKTGAKDSAAAHYLKALEVNPYLFTASIEMGKIMEGKEDFAQAALYYDMAVEAKPKTADYAYRAGRCNYRTGDFPAARQKLLKAAALDPRLADAHYMIGQILMTQRDTAAAAGAFGKALALNPDQPDYLRYTADALSHSGALPKAVPLYLRYLKKNGDDLEARANFGRCQMKLRNTKAALDEFDQVLKGKAPLIEEDFSIAGLYFNAKRFPEAKRILLNVLRLHPENAEAQVMVAGILESEKSFAQAADHYAEAVKSDKTLSALNRNIGDIHGQLGQEAKAIAAYEAYLADHKDAAIARKLLAIYQRLSRQDDARRMLALITAADPGGVAGLIALGDLDNEKGDSKAALLSYLKALKANPAHAQASYAAGKILLDQKNYKEAGRLLDIALKANPASSDAALAQGRLKQAINKPDEALWFYAKVLAAEPGNAVVLDTLISLYRGQGRANELKDALLKKTALNPKAGDAFAELGKLYLKAGQTQAAEAAYRTAIDIMGECLDCFLSLARICQAQKKGLEAIAYFRKAVYIDSKNAEILFDLGAACLAEKDSASALSAFEKAVALQKDHAGAVQALSRLYAAFKEQKKAIVMLQEMARSKPDDAAGRRALGKAYLDIKEYGKAEQELKASQQLDSKSAEVHFYFGLLYQELNIPDKCLENYGRAYELNPRDPEISGRYAQQLLSRKNYTKAVPVLLQRLKNDRKDTEAIQLLMECYLSLGDARRAMAFVTLLEKADPDKVKNNYDAGRVLYQAGKKDRALAILEAAGPRNDKAYYEMLGALYRERKQYPQAIDALKQVFNQDKTDFKAGFDLGDLYEKQAEDGLAVEIYKSLEISYPRDPTVKKKLLAVYRKMNKPDEARIVLLELVRLEPANAQTLCELARMSLDAGRKDSALTYLAAALKASPGHPQASLLYGRIRLEDKDYADAEPHLLKAIAALKDNPEAILALGMLYSAQSKPAKAIQYLEKSRSSDPQNMTAALALAAAYKAFRQTDKLLRLYQSILQADSKNAPAHKGLGDLYFDEGRRKEALAEYALVTDNGDQDVELRNRQAELLLEAGDVNAAIGQYQQSLRLSPNQPDIAFRLGMIFLEKRADEPTAKGLFEQAVQLDPKMTEASRKLSRLYLQDKDTASALRISLSAAKANAADTGALADLAMLLLKQGNFQKSEALVRKALEANPANIDLKLAAGRQYLEAGKTKEAEPLLNTVYASRPNDVNVMTDLIKVYNSLGESNKAIPILDQLQKAGTANSEVQMQLGIAYYGQQQIKKAKETLEKVLTQIDGTSEAVMTLGLIYLNENDLRRARLTFTKAIELDPANGAAHLGLGKLLYKDNNFSGAQPPLSKAMELLPENDEPVFYNLMCLVKLKQTEPALAASKEALVKFKRSDKIYFALASAYVLGAQYDMALKALLIAEKLNPMYREAFKLAGDVCFEFLKDNESAVFHYNRFLMVGGAVEDTPKELRERLK